MKRWWTFIIVVVVTVFVAILEDGELQPLFVHKYRFEWMILILLLCVAIAYLIPELTLLQSSLGEKDKTITDLEGEASRALAQHPISVLIDSEPCSGGGYEVMVVFELPHRQTGHFRSTRVFVDAPNTVSVNLLNLTYFAGMPPTIDEQFSTHRYKPLRDRKTYRCRLHVSDLTGMVKVTTRLVTEKTEEISGQASLEQSGLYT